MQPMSPRMPPRPCMADSHRIGPRPPTTEWQEANAANEPEDALRGSET